MLQADRDPEDVPKALESPSSGPGVSCFFVLIPKKDARGKEVVKILKERNLDPGLWPVLLSNIPSSFQSSGSRRAMECC